VKQIPDLYKQFIQNSCDVNMCKKITNSEVFVGASFFFFFNVKC
jgi:hypothetical protein